MSELCYGHILMTYIFVCRVFRLLLNLAGYATVMVPGFILYKYLQKSNYFDKISEYCLAHFWDGHRECRVLKW